MWVQGSWIRHAYWTLRTGRGQLIQAELKEKENVFARNLKERRQDLDFSSEKAFKASIDRNTQACKGGPLHGLEGCLGRVHRAR